MIKKASRSESTTLFGFAGCFILLDSRLRGNDRLMADSYF
jgi:hypothetical protein